jgi:hypothetical protein
VILDPPVTHQKGRGLHCMSSLVELELELELTQTQMTQKSSLVYTPHKQRDVACIDFGVGFGVMCPPEHVWLG